MTSHNDFDETKSLGNQSRWHIGRYLLSIGDWRGALRFFVFGKG